jgi:predicted RNA-binding Zn-ribbon protein involved in translation (DUF1610 family)
MLSQQDPAKGDRYVTTHSIRCASCDALIEEETDTKPENRKPCPRCGSTIRKFGVETAGSVPLHDSLKYALKSCASVKIVAEGMGGDDLHRKSGKWMQKERLIDHENDQYKEVVIDPATGEVVHRCEEPLSRHRGHGSAKPNAPKSKRSKRNPNSH